MRGMDAATGKPLAGVAHLQQSIRDILATRVGTRVHRRPYGSDVPRLIDRPANQALIVDVYAAAAEALARWEPRLKISRMKIDRLAVGQLSLTIDGSYRENGQDIRLEGIVL